MVSLQHGLMGFAHDILRFEKAQEDRNKYRELREVASGRGPIVYISGFD